jgi:uncharacterized protein YjdB
MLKLTGLILSLCFFTSCVPQQTELVFDEANIPKANIDDPSEDNSLDSKTPDFNQSYKILNSCFVCHGPGYRYGDLKSLTNEEDWIKEGYVVAGKPDESYLIKKLIHSKSSIGTMPPSNDLSLSEYDYLRRWISSIKVVKILGIETTPSISELEKGKTLPISLVVTPSNASNKKIIWTSSNNNVAIVSSSGLVSALDYGSATITARTEDGGLSANTILTVPQDMRVDSYSLINTSGNLVLGSIKDGEKLNFQDIKDLKLNFRANVSPMEVGSVYLSLQGPINSSLTDNNHTYDALGAGITLTEGNYTLSATPYSQKDRNGKVGAARTIKFNVFNGIKVLSIATSPSTSKLDIGEKIQISSVLMPVDATNKNIHWTSSNSSVATVNASGLVTALAVGSANITAKAEDGGIASITVVSVNQPLANSSIESFALLNATGDTVIRLLKEGEQLVLDDIKNLKLNFRANTSGDPVGSVQISLQGPVTSSRIDNDFSYDLLSNAGLSLVEGSYTLTATHYSQKDRGGSVGTARTLNFSVVKPELEVTVAKAFPGAEGFAKYITGGRGGEIRKVTNLNDSGPGSFREAASSTKPSTIVFEVSGTIALRSPLNLNSNTTVAGQTAPGEGITLKNYRLTVNGRKNIIIRFIRFRLGDVAGLEEDPISLRDSVDIIFDHCTFSWGVDETGTSYRNRNVTFQWCLMSEGLNKSVHSKGAHGYGGIFGGKNISYHHNLMAHFTQRSPRFDAPGLYKTQEQLDNFRGVVDFRNNVIYNWGQRASSGGEEGTVNIINNYYKVGPATTSTSSILVPGITDESGFGKFYLNGNILENNATVNKDNWKGVSISDGTPQSALMLNSPLPSDVYEKTYSAQEAYTRVLDFVGASYFRDSVDTRIIHETRTGTSTFKGSNGSVGGIIDSQNDVGGWPNLKSTAPLKDTDGDGMPDNWEIANGLNPNNADHSLYTLSKNYTNVEVYINSLVSHIMR